MIPNKLFWEDKKVLITGHTGFKGSWLSLYLSSLGTELYGVSREEYEGIYKIVNLKQIFKKEYFIDLGTTELIELSKIMQEVKPDIVFHFAAQSLVYKGYSAPRDTLFSNIIATHNVLESVSNVETTKSIIISTTDKVYENPDFDNTENAPLGGKDYYSASKVGVENIIKAFKNSNTEPNISVVRSGNVIGGGDRAEKRLTTEFLDSIISNNEFILRKPNSIRPWQYILDSIRGYLLVAEESFSKRVSEVYNLNSKPNNKFNAEYLAKNIIKNWQAPIKVVVSNEEIFKEVDTLIINSEKAKKILDWIPVVEIEEMILNVVNWEKHHLKNSSVEYSLNEINKYQDSLINFQKK